MNKPPPKTRASLLVAASIVLIGGALVRSIDLSPHDQDRNERRADTLTRATSVLAHCFVSQHLLPRPDGLVYTVDVAQLATAAARAGDRDTFAVLRDHLLKVTLLTGEHDPFIDGFVAWRSRPDPATEPLDASGTTEALRTAEALLAGIDAGFGHDDLPTVRRIAQGYLRHQYTEHGLWYIRNYFNLQTRAFSTNSFLIDFDPDLLHRLGERFEDEALQELSQKSVELIRRCETRSGLLHQMIRPEVATMLGPQFMVYSPNNAEQLNNVLAVAERCVVTERATAERVLAFAMSRLSGLRDVYDASSGVPMGERPASVDTFAALLRLAVRLGDERAIDRSAGALAEALRQMPMTTGRADLWQIGEVAWAITLWQRHHEATTR